MKMNFDSSHVGLKEQTMDNFPPDFNVSPLITYETKVFDQLDEKLRGFIVSLGCVYNDFKDIDWLNHQLEVSKPEDPSLISPKNGQWAGMANFVVRKKISIIFEFFELLKKNHEIFENDMVKNAELSLTRTYYKDWESLKDVTLRRNPAKDTFENRIWRLFNDVRNNVTSHYYSLGNFSKGFDLYKKENSADAKIYVSLGKTSEGTRFFFSDASTSFYLKDTLSKHHIEIGDIEEYSRKLSFGIRAILESILKLASGEIKVNREVRRNLVKKKQKMR